MCGLFQRCRDIALEFFDAVFVRALRKFCLLRSQFQLAQSLACLIQYLFTLEIDGLTILMGFLHLTQLDIQRLKRVLGFQLDLLLLGFLSVNLGKVAGDLGAALTKAFLHFSLTQQIDLQAMQRLR